MELITRSDDERLNEWGVSAYDGGDIGLQRALNDLALMKYSLRAVIAERNALKESNMEMLEAVKSAVLQGNAAIAAKEEE